MSAFFTCMRTAALLQAHTSSSASLHDGMTASVNSTWQLELAHSWTRNNFDGECVCLSVCVRVFCSWAPGVLTGMVVHRNSGITLENCEHAQCEVVRLVYVGVVSCHRVSVVVIGWSGRHEWTCCIHSSDSRSHPDVWVMTLLVQFLCCGRSGGLCGFLVCCAAICPAVW